MPFFIELGVMIGIIILASAIAKSFMPAKGGRTTGKAAKGDWHADRVDAAQRSEALKTYERLAREKLDVIKTAVAMGYSENELAALDARLEKLIGEDKLKSLLNMLLRFSKPVVALQQDHQVAVCRDQSRIDGQRLPGT